jgi:hypothetical protein
MKRSLGSVLLDARHGRQAMARGFRAFVQDLANGFQRRQVAGKWPASDGCRERDKFCPPAPTKQRGVIRQMIATPRREEKSPAKSRA